MDRLTGEFAALESGGQISFWTTDPKGYVISMSGLVLREHVDPGAALLGSDDLPGNLQMAARSRRALTEAVGDRAAFDAVRIVARDAQGRRRILALSGRPVTDAAGTFRGYAGFAVDVTELGLSSEALALISETLAKGRRENLLEDLVAALADWLSLDMVFVGRLLDGAEDRVVSAAAWRDGQAMECFEYDLATSPCGRVVGEGPTVITDHAADLYADDLGLVRMGAKGFVGVPLVGAATGRPIGVLAGVCRRSIADRAFMLDCMQAFAERAALELERREAVAANAARDRRISALLEAIQRLWRDNTDQKPLSEVVGAILEMCASAIGVIRVGLWVFDDTADRIDCIDFYDAVAGRHEASGPSLSRKAAPLYFESLLAERILKLDHALSDPRSSELKAYLDAFDVRSMLDVRISGGGRDIGVLCFEHTGAERNWSSEEAAFASSVADVLALAFLRERLRSAVEKVERRERQLSISYKAAKMGAFQVDVASDRVEWSPELVELLGLEPSSEALATLERNFLPGDYAEYRRRRAEALKSDRPFTGTMRLRTGNGDVRRLRYYGEPRRGAGGTGVELFGIIQDVTEVESLARQVETSRDQLLLAEQVGSFGSWSLDEKTETVEISPGARAILGLPEADAITIPDIMALFADEDVAEYRSKRQAMVETRETIEGEYDLKTPTTERRRVRLRAHPRFDEAGEFVGIFAVIQDITARHRANLESEAARQRLERAESFGAFGHWFGDYEDRTVTLSRGAASIMGLAAATALPRSIWQSGFPPSDLDRFEALRAEQLSKGADFDGEFDWRLSDGTVKRLRIHIQMNVDEGSGRRKGFAIVRDVTEEVRTKRALELSQEELRETNLIARIGFVRSDLRTGNSVMSPELAIVLGIEPGAEKIGARSKLFHPLDYAEYMRKREEAIRECGRFEGRMRFYPGGNGAERWVAYRVIQKPDETGRAIEGFGVFQDITEQVRLEEERARAEAFLRNVLENAALGINVKDGDGRFLLANRTSREQFGIGEIDLVGMTVGDALALGGNADLLPEILRREQSVLETGEAVDYGEAMRDGEGRLRDYQTVKFPIRDDGGRIFAVGTIRTDISDLTDAQRELERINRDLERLVADRTAELRVSEERYRLVAELSSDWIFELDETLTFTFATSGIENVGGRSAEDYVGLHLGAMAPDPDVVGTHAFQGWQEVFEAARRGEPIREREVCWRDGQRHVLLRFNAEPRSDRGGFRGYRGSATDITALHNARQQLAESEKMASLGRMVAGISHELNTPLGTARTIATLLLDKVETVKQEQASGALRRSSFETMLGMLDEGLPLLTRSLARSADLMARFKQVSADQTSGLRRRFSLCSVVADNVAALRPSFTDRPVEVAIDIPESLELDGYPGPLGQVVTNLVQNAYVHAFEGRDRGRIEIRAATDVRFPGAVVLAVRDDGVGLTPETEKRIFDPFFTSRLGSGGTGLGMHIVYNIVTGPLGGQVAARNRRSGGTEIAIVLPLIAPEAA